MQFEVLVEMGALRLESTGQLRSKYTVLLVLEAVKCVHNNSKYMLGHDVQRHRHVLCDAERP